MRLTGVTAYEGPSVLDGAPITCVVTFNSANQKTGNMAQSWVLRADMDPVSAVRMGADSSVCGVCPHRHFLKGACYVVPIQAPLQVWKRWKLGRYPPVSAVEPRRLLAYLGNRAIRLGSYGDPAAVPYPVWHGLVAIAGQHTGYTHQFRHPAFDPRLLELCMVSADTPRQAEAYHGQGLRTFRVKHPDQPLLEGEVYCPSERGVQCIACLKCSTGLGREGVVIDVHGSYAGRYLNGSKIIATDAAERPQTCEV